MLNKLKVTRRKLFSFIHCRGPSSKIIFQKISKYVTLIEDVSKYFKIYGINSKYFKESSWASFLIPLWMYNGWKDERMKGECSWMNSIHDYVSDDARDDVNSNVGDVTHDNYL